MVAPEEKFTLDNGLSWKTNPIDPKVNKVSVIGIICTKETRPNPGSKEETELIKSITTNQYNKYKLVSTSVKDPESLRTNLSIHDRIKSTEALWKSYDLLNPCHILFPDPDTSFYTPTLLDDGPKKGQPKTMYLFDHYRKLTAFDVAASCEFYAKYVTFPIPNKACGRPTATSVITLTQISMRRLIASSLNLLQNNKEAPYSSSFSLTIWSLITKPASSL